MAKIRWHAEDESGAAVALEADFLEPGAVGTRYQVGPTRVVSLDTSKQMKDIGSGKGHNESST